MKVMHANAPCLHISDNAADHSVLALRLDALPGLVEQCVRDLRSVLGHDTDHARFLLSRLLGDVILRPDAQGLVAEVRGNLGLLLADVPSIGAGRGI
jgi:hypothetical protein